MPVVLHPEWLTQLATAARQLENNKSESIEETASLMIDKIGRMVERIHRMKIGEMVSIAVVRLIHVRMADVVLKYVDDERLLRQIQQGWDMIEVQG
jgi:hypothetical protein